MGTTNVNRDRVSVAPNPHGPSSRSVGENPTDDGSATLRGETGTEEATRKAEGTSRDGKSTIAEGDPTTDLGDPMGTSALPFARFSRRICADSETATVRSEYVIQRIVGHQDRREGLFYKVRWYGYLPDDDTFEPDEAIPQPFKDRYWRWKHKRG